MADPLGIGDGAIEVGVFKEQDSRDEGWPLVPLPEGFGTSDAGHQNSSHADRIGSIVGDRSEDPRHTLEVVGIIEPLVAITNTAIDLADLRQGREAQWSRSQSSAARYLTTTAATLVR
jgi:hypothetical protein